jgi:hypothetical protein
MLRNFNSSLTLNVNNTKKKLNKNKKLIENFSNKKKSLFFKNIYLLYRILIRNLQNNFQSLLFLHILSNNFIS